MKKAQLQVSLPVMFLKEGKRFVAYTPALDISTSGKTLEQAQKRFAELAMVFLEEIVNMGTVDKVLSELGWQKLKHEWKPPVLVSKDVQKITIPAFA